MENQVIKMEESPVVKQKEISPLMMINKMLENGIDTEQKIAALEKMIDLQTRMEANQAKQAYYAAHVGMQNELPRVLKTRMHGGTKTKYASLDDINTEIAPILFKYGFSVSFSTENPTMDRVSVTAHLKHELGYSESTTLTLPLDTQGQKNGAQQIGSTVTYGNKYAFCSLINISTGDDIDGNTQVTPRLTRPQEDQLKSSIMASQAAGEWFKEKYGAIQKMPLTDFQLALVKMNQLTKKTEEENAGI